MASGAAAMSARRRGNLKAGMKDFIGFSGEGKEGMSVPAPAGRSGGSWG
jgi:hypothetical protein